MSEPANIIALHGRESSLLLSASKGDMPAILYWGARIDQAAVSSVPRLLASPRPNAEGRADARQAITFSCEPGTGFTELAGFEAHRDGAAWAPSLRVKVSASDATSATIECHDDKHALTSEYRLEMDVENDMVRVVSSFTNHADVPLTIDWATAVCLPIDAKLCDAITLSGRWAGEFQITRAPLRQGGLLLENRRGRTSHHRFPGVILCAEATTERAGPCVAAHLGWSGNHRTRVDQLPDGRQVLQMGELFYPGEMRLERGQTYTTPDLYVTYSSDGLSRASAAFHNTCRDRLLDERVTQKVRPVHYNTWEAIYFDHSPERVRALVEAAADLGVERFVLDDGWFRGRRNDTAGLGDWQVDESIYPDGLTPIIEDVKRHGMEFGLWVEPEMVNVDSDLYRQHPDWVLSAAHATPVAYRNQLVLDLAREDVAENIYSQIDGLLEHHAIDYLKWDMNRDLNHPGGADGKASAHRQTHAVYGLLDRLRAKHPHVEIESCSSGGGRTDFGILQRSDRVWTSDSNDAIDRQMIQRGASLFFPLCVLGSHVGPRECEITQRVLPMNLRVATAAFGHMGIEADISRLEDDERAELRDGVQFYKTYRQLIHEGIFLRCDGSSWQNIVGVVARDRQQALFSVVQMATNPNEQLGMLTFPGLDAKRNYALSIVWPTADRRAIGTSTGWAEGESFSGDVLAKVGIQLPPSVPQSCLVLELRAVS